MTALQTLEFKLCVLNESKEAIIATKEAFLKVTGEGLPAIEAAVQLWKDQVAACKEPRKLLNLVYVVNEVFTGLKQMWDSSKAEALCAAK